MKYVFLNPQSCSGLALRKWDKIAHDVQGLSEAIIVNDFYQIDWEKFTVNAGDIFISAGGDGTLHCMVNSLIRHKGINVLSDITIGHIGLGSNNSYLRPYSDCQMVNHIPMKILEKSFVQDLIEVEIIGQKESQFVYCVANASLGFLATANILFNKSPDIAVLKKWNSDLADVYTFLKALSKWKPITVDCELHGHKKPMSITNMHFMKKPFYATDLGFPETIPAANGHFRINVLMKKNRLSILKRFFSMLVLKQLLQGRDMTDEVERVKINSVAIIPLEMDGEIYYGKEFIIRSLREGIHLCS